MVIVFEIDPRTQVNKVVSSNLGGRVSDGMGLNLNCEGIMAELNMAC